MVFLLLGLSSLSAVLFACVAAEMPGGITFQRVRNAAECVGLARYRAWLRTNYSSSPFKEQEQVSALLVLYAEQQEQDRQRRGRQDWMNQGAGVYSLPYSRFNR